MNGWRVLLGALLFGNAAVLGWGLYSGSQQGVVPGSSALRADWVAVERPWEQAVEVVRPVEPVPPKINLKEGLAELDSAIENASKQVFEPSAAQSACLLWGPLLDNETSRVESALAKWAGTMDRLERQVPIGYVVYLPQEVVNAGVGLEQLAGKGIADMFYITTPGPLQGTISLGLFRDMERATAQRAELLRRGVDGVQIRPRLGPVRVFYQFKGTAPQLEQVRSAYRLNQKGSLGPCEA